MTTPLPPCRLHVILARDAPVGVIFRRGPSKRVQLIHWNTATDTFTPGQWFHGRIYEKLSDISPDGNLLLYAARKGMVYNWMGTGSFDYWTAVSKPPYLTALALWPNQASIGGGLFFDNTKVWLNFYGHPEPHPDHLPQNLYSYSSREEISEESLFDRRLEREGWQQAQELQDELTGNDPETGRITLHSGYVTHTPSVRIKPHLSCNLMLVMTTTHSGFRYRYGYTVKEGEKEIMSLKDAEWADWDHQGRLVYAQDGQIFAPAAYALSQDPPRELIDLNGNTLTPMVAPEWAKQW